MTKPVNPFREHIEILQLFAELFNIMLPGEYENYLKGKWEGVAG
jgi:hypothetical protein